MNLRVVRLGPDDWVSHRQLRLVSLRTAPTAFAMTYAESLDFDEADWRAHLADVGYWQVRDGDRAIGMAGLWEPPAADCAVTAYLIAMFVQPAARRRGAGELLLRTVVHEAYSRGRTEVRLHVETGNADALRIYERAGFRPRGGHEPHPHAKDLSEQTMVLALPPGWAGASRDVRPPACRRAGG